ncbi:zinc ribbon domain-containing protein [Natronorubrum sp. FCH18a]|uniref:zinc ribbon domain-containing protein n=1 Tax=Natronorubrum sp. FCH18a TaxID=3447018 RepID=UPI003F5199A7
MDDPGTLTTIGRIAVAVFVMIAPTLLFLGLMRGLERLRDDAVIDRWLYEQGRGSDDVLASVATVDGEASSSVPCSACGATNPSHATYCHGCFDRLS